MYMYSPKDPRDPLMDFEGECFDIQSLLDYLWAAVFCGFACTVTLTLGNSTQTFTNLLSGVSKLKFPMAPDQVIRMIKGSQTVIDASPTACSVVASPSLYNYNVLGALSVPAPSSASASTSTLSTSTSTSSASMSMSTSSTSKSTSSASPSTFTPSTSAPTSSTARSHFIRDHDHNFH
ncbi:glycoside hydrolase family 71 protein [Collybiopsis luxurians FD-317 M1]|uniref:Glycoside hydrolase family 71 protein n=1 Tax=Collybiopsis luxurians FD-317 M1 TaxID=944289 RepID=A0A0D0APU7_9AGAR|nr:glycoside hydrolase family 71 protein [Collybiopsis luxurians FD-317 M1]